LFDTLGVLELYPLQTLKYIEPIDHLLNIASFFVDFPTKEWTDVCMIVKVNLMFTFRDEEVAIKHSAQRNVTESHTSSLAKPMFHTASKRANL